MPLRQRLVGLGRHLPYDTRFESRAFPRNVQRFNVPVIHSMTGYALAAAEHPRGALSLELKSVNSRFLDLQFRVAEELRVLEPLLREAISARVARGKLE